MNLDSVNPCAVERVVMSFSTLRSAIGEPAAARSAGPLSITKNLRDDVTSES